MKKIMNDLNKQLIIGISLIVFISTTLVGLIFLTQYKSITLNKAEDELVIRAHEFSEIGKMVLLPSTTRPRDTYFEIMRNITDNELTIIDINKNIIITTIKGRKYNEGIINYINETEEKVTYDYSELFDNKTLTVISPITDGNNKIGTVILHQDVDSIYDSYISLIYLIIFSLIFSLVLSIVLAIIYARRFVLPIEKISKVAKEIKNGNYKEKVNLDRTDQLGELSSTMDQMSDEIDSNIKEILELESRAKELVANVSHEFKTPLTIIRGYAYSLKDKTIKPNNKVYEKIINNTIELEKLVNDLLDLNNYQSGKTKLEKEEFLLTELVSDTINELELVSKKIKINSKLEKVIINADKSKIRQLLIIILDNAIKFSKDKGEILVELTDKELTVKDFGVGIDKNELAKIFDKYYKVSSDESGYGIGLCIAKYIADIHNFELNIESKVNSGTKVTIKL